MTELDFMPQWYHVRQARRRSYFVLAWLAACMLSVMGLWFYLAHSRISQCRADLRKLQADRNLVNEHLFKIDRQRAVRDDLTRKSNIAEKLQNRPDAVHVVDRLVGLVAEEISLVALELTSELIKDGAGGESAKTPKRIGGPRGSGPPPVAQPAKAPPQTVERTRCQLKVTGVAPEDDSVAGFVTRLSRSEAFTNVQMGYTKTVKREGRLMREFQLTCQLVDDWQSEPAAAGGAGGRQAAAGAPSPEMAGVGQAGN